MNQYHTNVGQYHTNVVCNRYCPVMAGDINPMLCPHGRLWKYFATIGTTTYRQRISRTKHPITYLKARRNQ